MKFTYWGAIRGGKFQVWQLYEINGKKTVVLPQSGLKWPAYAIIYGGEFSHILYEENNQIKTKIHKHTVFEDGVYKNNFSLDGVERYGNWSKDPQVFYKCFGKLFEQDVIICPWLLFGYYGKIGTRDYNEMIEKREPNMKVDLDYTIEMLKQSHNLIPYRTDKKRETKLFQMTDPIPKICHKRQKHSERLISLTQGLFTEYEIPYEMFNLDDADYSIFGLPKPLPKNILEEEKNVGQVWSPQ
mgnify:CR=1 FL=1|tara:strand:- start:353 stop:1078 length:726 start_codon:yes stop_codon:yes gene_type:complete